MPYIISDKIGDVCSSSYCSSSNNCPGATCSSGTYQCLSGYTWVSQVQVAWASSIEKHGSCVPNSGKLQNRMK